MERKHKFLLTTSSIIASVAFFGGWIIFLVWVLARYVSALDLESLEPFAFLFLMSFIWLSAIALVLLTIYAIINRKDLHFKVFYTALLFFLCIPSAFVLIPLQEKIEKKVFIKLVNASGQDLELELYNEFKTFKIGSVKKGSTMIFNYDPMYSTEEKRSYQTPDSLSLIITQKGSTDTVGFPTFGNGECRELKINEKVEVKDF